MVVMSDTDIVADLRECAAKSRDLEGDYYADQFATAPEIFERAAAEIERLREAIRRLAEQDATLSVQGGNVTVTMDATFTNAERQAIKTAVGGFGMWVTENNLQGDESLRLALVTLRGLLDRLSPIASDCPVPDNAPKQDSDPPAWMARPYWVDPPSGWLYGFPRLYDPATDGDMTEWMIRNGYPKHLARQGLPCTFTAATDSQ